MRAKAPTGNSFQLSKVCQFAIVLALVTGCVSRRIVSTEFGVTDYSSFPQISFLPLEQARHVTLSPSARRHGELPEQDWRAIVKLLSCLPENALPGELSIVNISAASMWQTVSVHIQIGGNHMVVFVKVNKTDWVVAGIHEFWA